jgi:hypothetical protein
MFELPAVPQKGIPYVQIGFRIVVYISNLFSVVNSDFLTRIQYIVRISAPADFFWQICEFATSVFCRGGYLSICQ